MITSEVSHPEEFRLEHIYASYGSKEILKDISFTVPCPESKGVVVGLLGANGSGKSTLLKTICNQLPHKGQCWLHGQLLEQLPAKELARHISYIPQRSGIRISLSVLDVVLMGYHPVLKLFEQPSLQMRQDAMKALHTTGIEHLAEQDYLSLSEGEKQLCILARTLIEGTQLLLLDEPDSALDFHNKYRMLQLLTRLVKTQNKTAFLCIHDPAAALDFCDQLILLKKGTVSSVLFPEKDSLAVLKEGLTQVYGSVTLQKLTDSRQHSRFVLLSDIS